ncbi:MAG: RNA-directed DNA polymerase [Anaerostipes sp.]|jgi:RNA-directed DNA polymerase
MKRYGHLFEEICSIENLRKAHQHAKKGKGWYREVREIDKCPDYYLYYLQYLLKNHLYKTSDYEMFVKRDGKKERKIYKLPYFPDRVAQWAILQVIEPYIINHLIADTYSAIPKRGIHKGLDRLTKAMRTDVEGCQYCLKIDARHYYQSINHDVLKQKYRKMFKDEDLLLVLDEIIDSIDTADETDLCEIYLLEEDIDPATGIPIGNYLSQYSGNYYFSDFDHWMEEVKHVKHYFRYMDDIVIFAATKEELHKLLKEIDEYFRQNMKLKIKDNWQVFPTYVRGVDYLGYRVFMEYTLLRKDTCKQMKKKLTVIRQKCEAGKMMNYSEWCCIHSYNGWILPCDGFRLRQKYIVPLLPYADDYYKTNIKKKGGKAA